MNDAGRYVKVVGWSDADGVDIGSCPELFYGGCHGTDAKAVFAELCDLVEESVDLYRRDGKPLPAPMTGREFVNALQGVR